MNHYLFKCTYRHLLAAAMLAQVPSAFAAICNSTGTGNWNAAFWSHPSGRIVAAGHDVGQHLQAAMPR